uniref:Immunoglobulin domain-containing protein n=1 Tax=Poecilia formosa TaxID=48698 RepID=A0A087XXQ1_POEFO
MKNFVFIGAVLFSCCWISVVSQTVSVLPGENVNLLCNKHSGPPLFWFRLVNRTRISCISVSLSGSTRYCDEFKSGSFNIWSNSSTSVLRINQLNVSDSGLYFCGFATKQHRLFTVTQLHVNGTKTFYDDTEVQICFAAEGPPDNTKLITLTLRVLNVLLVTIIIVLLVKV